MITAADGARLFGRDTGFLFIEPDGHAPFVTTVHIVGGTRRYRGASGQFVAPGVLHLDTDATDGTYTSLICKDEDD